MIHGFPSVVGEENLIPRLGVALVETADRTIIACRLSAAGAVPAHRLIRHLHGDAEAEGRDIAPINEHIAPGVAVFREVVDAEAVEKCGILRPVPTASVGSLVFQLGVGGLFDVANLGSGRGDHSLNSGHGSFLLRGVGGFIFISLFLR